MRKASEKKVYYRLKEGRAYRKAMASMIDRVVDTFGGAAVSYLLGNRGSAIGAQIADLKMQVDKRRAKEKRDAYSIRGDRRSAPGVLVFAVFLERSSGLRRLDGRPPPRLLHACLR